MYFFNSLGRSIVTKLLNLPNREAKRAARAFDLGGKELAQKAVGHRSKAETVADSSNDHTRRLHKSQCVSDYTTGVILRIKDFSTL